MITREALQELAHQLHTPEHPNVVREYLQHLFLASLYRLDGAERLLFKGGTALRIVFGSPRFSEDLDFSLTGVPEGRRMGFVETLFAETLSTIERSGAMVRLGKPQPTSGGYYGDASFQLYDYPAVTVAINVSTRMGHGGPGEVASVAGDFVPSYTLIHLPVSEMVEEKVFSALIDRKKPRDFYDLYFLLRRGLVTVEQKRRLHALQGSVVTDAKGIDFREELAEFLPLDQQRIIKDFARTLERELARQLGGASSAGTVRVDTEQ
jgi:predicted nucleotidyltransferase component of viral defense system